MSRVLRDSCNQTKVMTEDELLIMFTDIGPDAQGKVEFRTFLEYFFGPSEEGKTSGRCNAQGLHGAASLMAGMCAEEVTQCVLVPRKIGELELDFENPTWKSNWDFEEITVKFIVRFTPNFVNFPDRPNWNWILKIQLGNLTGILRNLLLDSTSHKRI